MTWWPKQVALKLNETPLKGYMWVNTVNETFDIVTPTDIDASLLDDLKASYLHDVNGKKKLVSFKEL